MEQNDPIFGAANKPKQPKEEWAKGLVAQGMKVFRAPDDKCPGPALSKMLEVAVGSAAKILSQSDAELNAFGALGHAMGAIKGEPADADTVRERARYLVHYITDLLLEHLMEHERNEHGERDEDAA